VSDTTLEAILRRDRTVVALALVVVVVLSWTYLLYLAMQMDMPMPPTLSDAGVEMPGMDMSGMDMGIATPAGSPAWAPADFVFMFTMWAGMMVGMMTPSVAPMVLLYATVGRKARLDGKPFAPTGWFFAGYTLIWIVFSVAATIAHWLLTSLALLTPMMATASSTLGGFVLVAAGLYQWTPLKDVCLRQCQAPIAFLSSRGGFRSDPIGALQLGIEHGAYCLGCCWALMAILFVGGVMNFAWIGGIAILILLEKIVPAGRLVSRASGALLVIAGIWLIVESQ
jgi:predicted metal-binding membrane protein